MGRVAIVLSFERGEDEDGTPKVEIKCDPGGGANITAAHFEPVGVDAPPLAGDAVALEESTGAGIEHATGYQDPKNAGKAAGGEHRIFARDPDGKVICEFHLKGTGSARLENEKGFIELAASGVVEINGVKISTAGAIEAPGEVTANSASAPVKLSTHLHPTAMGPSGAPTPGT